VASSMEADRDGLCFPFKDGSLDFVLFFIGKGREGILSTHHCYHYEDPFVRQFARLQGHIRWVVSWAGCLLFIAFGNLSCDSVLVDAVWVAFRRPSRRPLEASRS
jgi:hypothetical protein